MTTAAVPRRLRISVAMTTCNGVRYLGPQLASLEKQTRAPDELVISDDASEDGTDVVLRDFARRSSVPVEVHRSRVRAGCIRNFEFVVRRCAGDVIVLCDQDDVWLPHKLAEIEKVFLTDENAVVAFSDGHLIGPSGRRTGRQLWAARRFGVSERTVLERDPLPALVRRSLVSGCAMAFSAAYRHLLEPFPPDPAGPGVRVFHDHWIAMVLATLGGVHALPEPLIEYRLHPAQHIGIPGLRLRRLVPPSAVSWQQVLLPPQHIANRIATSIRLLEAIAERIDKGVDGQRRDEALRRIERSLAHLRFRASVRARPHRSRTPILDRVLSGEYAQFSLGVATAVADAIAPVTAKAA
jgi:glycosyltransferase involved in cell wall biosynthesis